LASMFHSASLDSLSSKQGIIETSGFVDLGLCYRIIDENSVAVRVFPLCEAASKALLVIFSSELPKQAEFVTMIKNLKSKNINTYDFEDLVWKLLICGAVSEKGLKVPTYYLNGKTAGDINLKFDSYYVVTWQNEFPDSLHGQHVLYRMINDYPKFDFTSLQTFIQISKSKFTDHNKGSASIQDAFEFEFYETKEDFNANCKLPKKRQKMDLIHRLHC